MSNLAGECRPHHRVKTLADNGRNGWRVRMRERRRMECITPTGASAVTEPEGLPYLFSHLDIDLPVIPRRDEPDLPPTEYEPAPRVSSAPHRTGRARLRLAAVLTQLGVHETTVRVG